MRAKGAFVVLLLQLATADQHEFIYRKEPQPIGSRRPICTIDEDRGECNLDDTVKGDVSKVYSKVKVATPLITVPPRKIAGSRRLVLNGLCPVLKAEDFTCSPDPQSGELKAQIADLFSYGSIAKDITLEVVRSEGPVSSNTNQQFCASFSCPAGTEHKENSEGRLCSQTFLSNGLTTFACDAETCCQAVPPDLSCQLKDLSLVYSEVDQLSLRLDYDKCTSIDGFRKASLLVGLKKVSYDDPKLIRPRTNTTNKWHADVKNFFHGVCPGIGFKMPIFRPPIIPNLPPKTTAVPGTTEEPQVFPTAGPGNFTDWPNGSSRRLQAKISASTESTLKMYEPTDLKIGLASHEHHASTMPRYPCFANSVDVQFIHATPGCYDDMIMFTATAPDEVSFSPIFVPELEYNELLGVAKALKANATGIPHGGFQADPCKPIAPGVPGIVIADRMCVEIPDCAYSDRANPYHCDNRCGACSAINSEGGVTTTKPPIILASECQKCLPMELLMFGILALLTACCTRTCGPCLKIESAETSKDFLKENAEYSTEFDSRTGFSNTQQNASLGGGGPSRKKVAKVNLCNYLLACLLLLVFCYVIFFLLWALFAGALNEALDLPAECPCHMFPEKFIWAFCIWLLCSFILGWFFLRREIVMVVELKQTNSVEAKYGSPGGCNVQ